MITTCKTNHRFRAKYLSKDERRAMLPAVAVDAFLARLHKAECNLFDPALNKRDPTLPLALYWRKFRNTY